MMSDRCLLLDLLRNCEAFTQSDGPNRGHRRRFLFSRPGRTRAFHPRASSSALPSSASSFRPEPASAELRGVVSRGRRWKSVGTRPRMAFVRWRPETQRFSVASSPRPAMHMAKTGPSSPGGQRWENFKIKKKTHAITRKERPAYRCRRRTSPRPLNRGPNPNLGSGDSPNNPLGHKRGLPEGGQARWRLGGDTGRLQEGVWSLNISI